MWCGRVKSLIVAVIAGTLAGLMSGQPVLAQNISIVALGASNTYGKTVSRSQAYPAHLQRMLKARGINARVRNMGRNGKPTRWMLRQARSIPRGTRLVILQPGGNDRRLGISPAVRRSNISKISGLLRRKGIKVIVLRNRTIGQLGKRYPRPDGSHFTPSGYRALAATLLPQVLGAIGR